MNFKTTFFVFSFIKLIILVNGDEIDCIDILDCTKDGYGNLTISDTDQDDGQVKDFFF